MIGTEAIAVQQHAAHRQRQRLAAACVAQLVDLAAGASACLMGRPAGEAFGHRVDVLDHTGLVGGDDTVADGGQRHLCQVALAVQLRLDDIAQLRNPTDPMSLKPEVKAGG